jgi:hypothetical protein
MSGSCCASTNGGQRVNKPDTGPHRKLRVGNTVVANKTLEAIPYSCGAASLEATATKLKLEVSECIPPSHGPSLRSMLCRYENW